MRPYLVFCSTASLSSCIPELFGKDREFDVYLHDYSSDMVTPSWAKEPEYYFWMPGHEKLEVARAHIPVPLGYKQYAFLDDDLTISTESLNQLFQVGEALRLPMYQPVLTKDSYGSHAHLFDTGRDAIRPVPFVEIMCPFFSREALGKCLPTFDLNISGWGLDCYMWPTLVPRQYVIEAIPVGHYREPARRDRVARNGLTPAQECWIVGKIVDPNIGGAPPL